MSCLHSASPLQASQAEALRNCICSWFICRLLRSGPGTRCPEHSKSLVFWSGCLHAFGNIFLAKSRDHIKKAKVLQLAGCCKEMVRGRVISGSPPVGITASEALEQMDPTCEEFQRCSAEV